MNELGIPQDVIQNLLQLDPSKDGDTLKSRLLQSTVVEDGGLEDVEDEEKSQKP